MESFCGNAFLLWLVFPSRYVSSPTSSDCQVSGTMSVSRQIERLFNGSSSWSGCSSSAPSHSLYPHLYTSLRRKLTIDAQCAHGSDDHITDVLSNFNLCGCVPTVVSLDWILALDVVPFRIMLTFRYWVSPIQWMVSATVSNALHGIKVTCTSEELSIIQPPSGSHQSGR